MKDRFDAANQQAALTSIELACAGFRRSWLHVRAQLENLDLRGDRLTQFWVWAQGSAENALAALIGYELGILHKDDVERMLAGNAPARCRPERVVCLVGAWRECQPAVMA